MTSLQLPTERRELIGALLDALAASAPGEDGRPGRSIPTAILQTDYAHGVLDLLSLFGAVRQRAGAETAAVSMQAGWAIGLLRALLDLDAPMIADWDSRGLTPAGALPVEPRAPDFLAALESRRQALLPQAAPLRKTVASVGLITRQGDADGIELLLVYDPDARAWQLPGGRHEDTDATPEITLLRELHEEIGLSAAPEGNELAIEPLPRVSETRLSPTYGLLTRVDFQMYRVYLSRPYTPVDTNIRWVRMAEIEAGETGDGMAIAVGPLRQQAAQRCVGIAELL